MSDDIWDEYLSEDNATLWKERYEFLASLALIVLQKIDIVKPWKNIAINAVYEYESHRQEYIDDDLSGILTRTVKGDWWVIPRHISSSGGRKKVRVVLEAKGFYIAIITGQGVILTDDSKEIQADFGRNFDNIRSRAVTMSKTAIRMRDKTELPTVVVQAKLTDGVLEDA